MDDHLSPEQMERFRRRELAPLELLDADDHLAACAVCRETLAAGPAAPAPPAEAPALPETPYHLPEEHVAGYVDGALDSVDREIAEAHLELCERCAEEVRELRAFRALLSTYPPREHAPAVRRGVLARLDAFLSRPPRGFLIVTAGAAMALVAAGGFSLSAAAGRAERLARANAALERQAAAIPLLEGERDAARRDAELQAAERQRAERELRELRARNAAAPSPAPPGPLRPAGPGPGKPLQVADAAVPLPVEAPAEIRELVGTAGRLRGGPAEGMPFAVVAPVGVTVLEERPTFRWQPLSGAEHYVVTVAGPDGDVAAQSPPLTAASWTPPQPLRRGAAYTWQVVATTPEGERASPVPPAPEARFTLLDAARARAVRRAAGESRLALGRRYARAGLLDDAERELQAALDADPDSAAARGELAAVRGWRRARW